MFRNALILGASLLFCNVIQAAPLKIEIKKYESHDEILRKVQEKVVEKNPRIKDKGFTKEVIDTLYKEAMECLEAEDFYTTSLLWEFLDDIDLILQLMYSTALEKSFSEESVEAYMNKKKEDLQNEMDNKYMELYGIKEG